MIKKILSIFYINILISSIAINVTSCSTDQYDNKIWEIVPGFLHDKSYNQAIYSGAINHLRSINNNKIPSYYQLSKYTTKDFINAYLTASYYKAEYALLPGFNQLNNLKYACQHIPKNIFYGGYIPGQNYNTRNDRNISNKQYKNLVAINFSYQISGFYAGLYACSYLSNLSNRTIGTFGGVNSPLGVDNYMIGFLMGAAYWNYTISSGTSNRKAELDTLCSFLHPNTKAKIVKLNSFQGQINSDGSMKLNDSFNWFSGSFLVGHATTISEKIIEANANVIFPVAGIQIQDTLSVIKRLNAPIKLVGVDTDQYPIYGKYILCSAVSDLVKATEYILKDNNFNQNKGKTIVTDFTKYNWSKVVSPLNPQFASKIMDTTKGFQEFNQKFYNFYNKNIKYNYSWKEIINILNKNNIVQTIENS